MCATCQGTGIRPKTPGSSNHRPEDSAGRHQPQDPSGPSPAHQQVGSNAGPASPTSAQAPTPGQIQPCSRPWQDPAHSLAGQSHPPRPAGPQPCPPAALPSSRHLGPLSQLPAGFTHWWADIRFRTTSIPQPLVSGISLNHQQSDSSSEQHGLCNQRF